MNIVSGISYFPNSVLQLCTALPLVLHNKSLSLALRNTLRLLQRDESL